MQRRKDSLEHATKDIALSEAAMPDLRERRAISNTPV
jgi:hypothetical protein